MNANQITSPLMRIVPDTKPRINLYEYRLVEQGVQDIPDEHLESGLHALRIYGRLALGLCLDDEINAYRQHRAAKALRPAFSLQRAN